MLKDDLNMYAFQNKNWLSPKSDRWFFFKIWLSEGLSIERIFNEKKYESTGLISEKTEALYVLLYAVLNKRAEAATSSYSVTGDFFPSQIMNLLTILIMVTEELYWRKTFCGCFRFIRLWLLISIMKRCAERCELQLHHTSSVLA